MSLLPTAHAGQAFGSRRIDFFTVSGEVATAKGHASRVVDDDGAPHDIRLQERSDALQSGDAATVLRVQAGPNRRSRPVAVINHTRQTWVRTAPDATSLLARSGVVRSLNWWLAMAFLALTAIAVVWPDLHAFFTEMAVPGMASVPNFDILGELRALIPGLAGWRLQDSLPGGLLDAILALDLIAADQLTLAGLAAAGAVVTMAAFFARSWRLIYVPLLAAFALMAGGIYGAAAPTLIILGAAMLVFIVGGIVNRIRDSGRFNARVERLAEHVLRNPPQESVRASEPAQRPDSGLAATAAATTGAATLAGGQAAASDASAAETVSADAASPSDDASNGEVEAGPEIELPPVADAGATAVASDLAAADAGQAGEADAAPADDATPVTALEPETHPDTHPETGPAPAVETDTADAPVADSSEAEPVAAAPAPSADNTEPAATTAPTPAAPDTVDSLPVPAEAADTAAAADETGATDADEADDLPSLDAVAAAAALSAAEAAGEPDADAPETATETARPAPAVKPDLDDERTMPVAPPPPMPAADADRAEPAADAAEAPDETPADETRADQGPADDADAPEPHAEAADAHDADDATARLAAASAASAPSQAPSSSPVDDPLMDDAGDPMLPRTQRGDYAPGAPDLDIDSRPAE